MPIFSSGKSWTNQAQNTGNPAGQRNIFGFKKTCPPVRDCPVKQSLMASAKEQRLWGVRTKKEVGEAKKLAGKIAAQQRAGRQAAKWPYKGSYDPTKGKK